MRTEPRGVRADSAFGGEAIVNRTGRARACHRKRMWRVRNRAVSLVSRANTAYSHSPRGVRDISAVSGHPAPLDATTIADRYGRYRGSSKRVNYSRAQLADRFAELEEALTRLARSDAPEEDRWAAFEQLVHMPAAAIHENDRRWWWEQVYATMERHSLTELSRLASSGRG